MKTGTIVAVAALVALGAYGALKLNMGGAEEGRGRMGPQMGGSEQGVQKNLAPGDPMRKVVVPELTGEAKMGERAFNAKCAVCHGKNAAGQMGVAPPLIHQYYRPGHHGDAAFYNAALNGVRSHHWRFGDMPPVQGITRAEIKTIVTYIRTLQRANGIK